MHILQYSEKHAAHTWPQNEYNIACFLKFTKNVSFLQIILRIYLFFSGRLSSRQKSQDQQPQQQQQQQQYSGGQFYGRDNVGEREEPWNPGMLGSDPPRDSGRRLHQQLSGLSSSNSSDDEDAINSDATFTGSEVALARESTLVLPSRRK